MTKITLALATALVLGSATVGLAGEGSPDLSYPSRAEYYGQRMDAPIYSGPRTVAPVAARTSIQGQDQGRNAAVPSFDDAERQWMERASRPYNG
jgi:hypothetical protein